MFPGAHARIYRNEAGEVLGWDYPSDDPYDPDDFDDRDDPYWYADEEEDEDEDTDDDPDERK